jgi:alkanesulfonate monooxygenase SsuD/methylene tetrahydromethanopterin reductase-like flavin-dependent oxidoreductase (luciferase family)
VAVVKDQLRTQWGAAADRIIAGSLLGRPEDAMEQIAAFVEAGAELVNIAIRPPWNQDLLAEYFETIVPMMKREWS